jgi:hypothetical protein
MTRTSEGSVAMAKKAKDGPAERPDIGRDYEVGYCKPPLATRFPRGTSGNPLGRPKPQRAKATFGGAMRELLMSDVTVIVDGRRRRMLRIEALADALIAIAGNASAARLALDLAYKFVRPDETIADMHQALKHPPGASKSKDFFTFTDEERARMSYESITRDMDLPPDDGASVGGPAADGNPPDGSRGT